MKKLICLALLSLTALVLTSCSGGDENLPVDEKAAEQNQANMPDIDTSKG